MRAEITRKLTDARERSLAVLEQVGLADRVHHYPSELSVANSNASPSPELS